MLAGMKILHFEILTELFDKRWVRHRNVLRVHSGTRLWKQANGKAVSGANGNSGVAWTGCHRMYGAYLSIMGDPYNSISGSPGQPMTAWLSHCNSTTGNFQAKLTGAWWIVNCTYSVKWSTYDKHDQGSDGGLLCQSRRKLLFGIFW